MKRLFPALAAFVLALLFPLVGTLNAQAAGNDAITRFDVVATVNEDGSLNVVQTIDDYFSTPGHGPYVYFVTRQGYSSTQDRLYTYSKISVTSTTGAPTTVQETSESTYIQLRIGDPNKTVSGTQTYVISYTVAGGLNPKVEESGMDELYWNVIGTGWELPIQNVSVTIKSAHDVQKTACYFGDDYKTDCTSNDASSTTASFTQSSLDPGEGLAIATGWAGGTFPNAKIDLVGKQQNALSLTGNGIWAGIVSGIAAIGAGFGITRFAKRGRDEQYANVTPGMLPAQGQQTDLIRAEVKDAAVEFAPPEGIPPRLVGAIAREGVDNVDVTSSIIDMCVRGYIHMNQGQGQEFTLQRTTRDPRDLNPVDARMYSNLFAKSPAISREEMADESFYETYTDMKTTISEEFDAQKWYKDSPKKVVWRYRMLGFGIIIAGVIVAGGIGPILAVAGLGGWAWLWVPFAVFGIGVIVVAKRMPVRTPLGSAVATQALGFKKYLETAEADQIKWEEGQDIFSKYLPYAIAFGCADRWAKVFESLAAAGQPVPQPQWYTGYGTGYGFGYGWASISNSMSNIGNSFSESVSAHAAAQAAASGGSMGGSGFSGGGGGGGFGGGGGGNW